MQKFSVGDKVWFVDCDMIESGEITSIERDDDNRDAYWYEIDADYFIYNTCNAGNLHKDKNGAIREILTYKTNEFARLQQEIDQLQQELN